MHPKPNYDREALSVFQIYKAYHNQHGNLTNVLDTQFQDFKSKINLDPNIDFSTKCYIINNLHEHLTALGLIIK